MGFVNYCHLLVYLLGGVESALSQWAELPPQFIWAPLPLIPFRLCTPRAIFGEWALKQVWFWSYQYVVISPFMAFIEVAASGLFREDIVEDAKLMFSVIQIFSTCACMYHVAVLRDVCMDLKSLQSLNVGAKFSVIYAIIILAKILGLILISFLSSKQLENGLTLSGNEHGFLWTNFITCIVVGLASLLALKAFPVSECEVYAMKEDDEQNNEKSVTFHDARMDSTLIPHLPSMNLSTASRNNVDVVSQFLLSNRFESVGKILEQGAAANAFLM